MTISLITSEDFNNIKYKWLSYNIYIYIYIYNIYVFYNIYIYIYNMLYGANKFKMLGNHWCIYTKWYTL